MNGVRHIHGIPDRYMAVLVGGPFDGKQAEIVRAPRRLVVANDDRGVMRVGDYDENLPPDGMAIYLLADVDDRAVARYEHEEA